MNPIFFAIFAAGSFGLWTIFHKLASPYINQVFGAIVVSLSAVIFGSFFLLYSVKTQPLYSNYKGILYLILGGVLAFLIDYLALKAYSKGLSLTIGGPIIIGGSVAVAVITGFVLGDAITLPKILGIMLVISGAAILAVFS